VVALVGAATLGAPTKSHANFQVQFNYLGGSILVDGTAMTASASGGASLSGATIIYSAGQIQILGLTVSNLGTTGGFKLNATVAQSNSPGASDLATIDISNVTIKNQTTLAQTGGVSAFSDLFFKIGDTGFLSPGGDPSAPVISSMSATASGTNTHNASLSMTSYLDNTNAQFGTQQSTPTINLTVGPGASQSDNKLAYLNTAPTPYSLTEVGKVTLFSGERLVDGSSATTVTTPAPGGLVLALACLPVLGVGAWVHRRRALALA